MKRKLLFLLLGVAAIIPWNHALCETCEITVSHQNGNSVTYDFLVYNRIIFGDDGMRLVSSTDPSVEPIELSYNDYERISFSSGAGIADVIGSEYRLVYDKGTECLRIDGADGEPFTIAIYSLTGLMVAQGNAPLSADQLTNGVYIAIASDNRSILKLKFIK